MATYFYDFSEYADGDLDGVDWIVGRSQTGSLQKIDSARLKQYFSPPSSWGDGYGYAICAEAGYTDVGGSDIEVVCKWKCTNSITVGSPTQEEPFGPILVASDGVGATFSRTGTNLYRLMLYGLAGRYAWLDAAAFSFTDAAADTYIWMRIGRVSGVYRGKIWAGDLGDEPGAWHDGNNTPITSQVRAGVCYFDEDCGPNYTDLFGIGLGTGVTAPGSAGNNAPVFGGPSISNLSGTVGVAITSQDVSARFSDADSDPLTFSQQGSWPARSGGGNWVSSAGVISGTPDTASEGTYTGLEVRASDGTDTVDSNSFSFVVSPAVSTPPTITSVSGAVVHGSSLVVYGTNLTDAAVTLSYSTVVVAQSEVSQSLTITIPTVSSLTLPFGVITLTATTSEGSVTFPVTHAPPSTRAYVVVDVPWDTRGQSIFENGAGAVDGDQIDYELLSTRNAECQVRADGTILVNSASGSHAFDVRLWDESALVWGTTTVITVSDAGYIPSAPAWDGPDIDDYSLTIGDTILLNVSTRFSDPDGDIATYTKIGTWPTWLGLSNGLISGVSQVGEWTDLSVRATDSGGRTANSNAFSVTVIPIPPEDPNYTDVDKIIVQNTGGSKTVNELNGTEFIVRPVDYLGAAAYPVTMHWKMIDEYGNTAVDWTELPLTVIYGSDGELSETYAEIIITGSLNTVSKGTVTKTLLIAADKDLSGELSRSYSYKVRKLQGRS